MNKFGKLLLCCAFVYIPVSAAFAASDWIIGARQNRKCRCIDRGTKRLEQGDVKLLALYSGEQIKNNPALGSVRLYFLPGNSSEKKPYILFLPGGAYLECDTKKVALPSASEANLLGYSAFVLKYRVRKHTDNYAPVDDVAAAIQYINAHADELKVEADKYMITGFSAGGNLAGLFASSELGYKKYGLGKPAALTLLYPWTNINAPVRPCGNLFKDGYMLLGRTLAIRVLLGAHCTNAEKERLCIHNLLSRDFPPCNIIHGDRDFLVPKENNSELLVKKFEEYGVPCEYRVCPGLTHGFGLGIGTSAEGWVKKSIAFWEKSLSE